MRRGVHAVFDDIARLQDSIHRVDASLEARAEAEDRGGRVIHLLTVDELNALPHPAWAIKGVLLRRGLAAIFGPSGSGKSFLLKDILHAVSRGEDWMGHRVPTALPVCYVALEGQVSIPLRVEALAREKGPFGPGFRVLLGRWQLTNPDDVADLGEALRAFPGAVTCIDTLHAASPEMDENSSRDMGMSIEGAKILQRITGGLVLLVHHTGKDAQRGMRGHSSLRAALDCAIAVEREGDSRSWRIDKSKDSVDGAVHPFRLRQVVLGTDDDGDDITSCVVEPCEQPRENFVTGREVQILDVLKKLCATSTPRLEDWRTECIAQGLIIGPTDDARKKSMDRTRDRLISAGLLSRGMSRGIYIPAQVGDEG